jgi:hypothetical protein
VAVCARERKRSRRRDRPIERGKRSIEHGWCGYYATEVGSHILELLGWRIVR